MKPGIVTTYRWPQHQRQEALQRLAAGETMADVARTYAVDATTIGRLAVASPFERAAVGGVQ
jgi:hypothetical protein